jgi:hypothetical protein
MSMERSVIIRVDLGREGSGGFYGNQVWSNYYRKSFSRTHVQENRG